MNKIEKIFSKGLRNLPTINGKQVPLKKVLKEVGVTHLTNNKKPMEGI